MLKIVDYVGRFSDKTNIKFLMLLATQHLPGLSHHRYCSYMQVLQAMLLFPFDNFIDDSLERQHLNVYDEVDLILVTVALYFRHRLV